jgi:hypothetical protein
LRSAIASVMPLPSPSSMTLRRCSTPWTSAPSMLSLRLAWLWLVVPHLDSRALDLGEGSVLLNGVPGRWMECKNRRHMCCCLMMLNIPNSC